MTLHLVQTIMATGRTSSSGNKPSDQPRYIQQWFDTSEDSGLYYYSISDGTAGVIWKGDPTATPSNMTIPSSITFNNKDYTVSEIGAGAFEGAVFLVTIALPNTIQYMAEDAFKNCSNLQTEIDLTKYSQNVAVEQSISSYAAEPDIENTIQQYF